jgi:hypothetical protein
VKPEDEVNFQSIENENYNIEINQRSISNKMQASASMSNKYNNDDTSNNEILFNKTIKMGIEDKNLKQNNIKFDKKVRYNLKYFTPPPYTERVTRRYKSFYKKIPKNEEKYDNLNKSKLKEIIYSGHFEKFNR